MPMDVLPEQSLSVAALGGQNGMIQFLLDKGFDLEHEGQFGSPLRAASIMGHESTVQLLLGLGADVAANGSFGDALQAAATKGHVTIVKMLSHKGADVKAEGGYYGNSLQAAAFQGHQEVAKILLNAGAEVYQLGFSKDAFHAAAEGGNEEIVHLFLERGFTLRSPLHPPSALLRSPSPFRNFLRDVSPAPENQNTLSRLRPPRSSRPRPSISASPLHGIDGALEREMMDIPHCPDERSPKYANNYAHKAAAANGHTHVVKTILDHWASIGGKAFEDEIGAAFHEASSNGHGGVVKLLLESRWDHLSTGNRRIKTCRIKGTHLGG